jgi:hypothetical protein
MQVPMDRSIPRSVLCSWQFVPFKYSNNKVKFTLEQAVKAQMALDGDGWSTPHPGRFTSRMVNGIRCQMVEYVRKI